MLKREYKTLQREGERFEVCFREFQPGDAAGIAACIRDEYEGTYLKPEFYHTDFILRGEQEGQFHFLVAEAEGRVVAALGLKWGTARESMCEWIAGVVLKEYRRFGMMNVLFQKALEEMEERKGIPSGYGFSVTYHDISQRSMGRLGFVPCGFLLSVLFIENISHSYARDKNRKHHHIIIVRRQEKREAGTLHIPSEHEGIARQVYDSLGVSVAVDTSCYPLYGKSRCEAENDAGQASCAIWVEESGEDLGTCIEALEKRFPEADQTFNVFLNISDARAVAAYGMLRRRGYFFTGWRPISGSREYMVLHHPGQVAIDFDSLAIAEAGQKLRDYVKQCYMNRGNPNE